MKKLVALSLACSLCSLNVMAKEPSFNFVEGGYFNGEADSGLLLRGNAELGNNLFLNLGSEWYEDENDTADFNFSYLGLGYKHQLDSNTSLYGLFNIVEFSVEAESGPITISGSNTGYEYGLGVRSQLTDMTQVYGQISHIDFGEGEDGNVLNAGVRQAILPNLAAYAEVKRSLDSEDDSNEFGIGLTYNF